MNKNIRAEFESVDMAELAARNIRYKFDGISKISIRYSAFREAEEYFSLPVSAVNNTIGVGFPQVYEDESYQDEPRGTEEFNRSSILLVDAEETVAERIAAYLRSLGGLGIKISSL